MLTTIAAIVLASSLGAQADWTDYDAADAKLTAAYRSLMVNSPAQSRVAIRDSERGWIARRNQACGQEAKNRCATKFTIQRTAELEAGLGRAQDYRSRSDAELQKLDDIMNEECRGGPGQDPDGPVCSRRDAVFRLLNDRGWCWGPDSAESEVERRWMKAGPRCRPYHGD